LARYKFTNELSQAELLTSEFERAKELRAFCPALLVASYAKKEAIKRRGPSI
jgi:hypothetical protein